MSFPYLRGGRGLGGAEQGEGKYDVYGFICLENSEITQKNVIRNYLLEMEMAWLVWLRV